MHLFGNMLFLYLYGDNPEDALGKARYFVFYILCGFLPICPVADQSLSEIPMVGASEAILLLQATLPPTSQYPGHLLVLFIYRHSLPTRLSGAGVVGI